MNLRRLHLLLSIAVILFVCTVPQAFGQGCAQCLDTTRATPPAVQAAYRHAILLLVGAASGFFVIGLVLLRRNS